MNTLVELDDLLPLTCSRKGSCCHGNQVLLNPWEVSRLSLATKVSTKAFQTRFTDLEGIRLRFDAEKNEFGKKACRLYVNDFGCSVHENRPLACRLFPLGRQIQNNHVFYIHEGKEFPCLAECPEVLTLPKLTVKTYVQEQQTKDYERAQDLYLDLTQYIADQAFMLLLDTGLHAAFISQTLETWGLMGAESVDDLVKRVDADLISHLLLPDLLVEEVSPDSFVDAHQAVLEQVFQTRFDAIQSLEEVTVTCVQIMSLALILAKSIGADSSALMQLWIQIAKDNLA